MRTVKTRFPANMVAERHGSRERISERTAEQIADAHVPQVVKRTIEVPKMAEQILDVLVPEVVEQKLLETVSDDRIQQRNVEQTVDSPVPHDVEELVEFFKASTLDRVQQSSAETIETPDISLDVKIIEVPVIRTQETQQLVNTHVQHVVNTVEVEKPKLIKETVQRKKPIIQETINQLTKHIDVPQVQFLDKADDMSVVVQRQISMVQTVQTRKEMPQLQYGDEVIDVPVVSVVQVPRVWVVKKTVEDPQFQIVDKTVENPETRTIQGLVVQAPLVQVMAKTVQTPQLLFREKIVVIPGIQTVQALQTSESLNGEISTFQLDTMCADEQDVFTKVNADLEQVPCETCVKDNTAMVAEVGDLSSTSGSMHQQRTSGQAGEEEREKKEMEGREGKEKGKVRGKEERKSHGEGVQRGNGKEQERKRKRKSRRLRRT